MINDDHSLKYRVPEALEKLRAIIDQLEKWHPGSPTILPSFLSVTYGGYEHQWHHSVATFLCSVEYTETDVDSQVRALEALKRLCEHISAKEEEWQLPTGQKSTSVKWHKARDGTYHPHFTESSIMDSAVASEHHGTEGLLSVSFGLGPVQMNYTRRARPRVALLASYRYRAKKARL